MQIPMPYERRGGRARLAKYLGISDSYLSEILNGKKGVSKKLTLKFEAYFARTGIPMNRWDLLFGMRKGETFKEYLQRKSAK